MKAQTQSLIPDNIRAFLSMRLMVLLLMHTLLLSRYDIYLSTQLRSKTLLFNQKEQKYTYTFYTRQPKLVLLSHQTLLPMSYKSFNRYSKQLYTIGYHFFFSLDFVIGLSFNFLLSFDYLYLVHWLLEWRSTRPD